MRVAVLTLTRDRLDYTKHCFGTLRQHAHCDYDHFVLDQGSTDGTQDWLFEHAGDFAHIEMLNENVGISRGLNRLIKQAGDGYDVFVKFDNDCELTANETLRVACEIADRNPGWIVSPHIHGLLQPPPILALVSVNGRRVGLVHGLGGIFMAIPGWVFNQAGYRYNDQNPVWGMDDVNLSQWFRDQGGNLGYLLDYPAWHYKSTVGQREDLPDYFERKDREYAGA